MQLLSDGGGVYTNTPCPGCHVSRNYMEGDPHVYGCLYHDGGSGLWTDENNVFNHIGTSAVFCHGNCPGISMSPIFFNDSGKPNMQGATNSKVSSKVLPVCCASARIVSKTVPVRAVYLSLKLHNTQGVCVAPTIVELAPGAAWSGVAAEVVQAAGRRAVPGLLVAPAVSAPVNTTQNRLDLTGCVRFGARTCDPSKPSQKW